MYEIELQCRGCGDTHAVNCDASGYSAGIPKRCPHCGESHPHDPVDDPEPVDDPSTVETVLGEVDEDVQRAQSAAYGDNR